MRQKAEGSENPAMNGSAEWDVMPGPFVKSLRMGAGAGHRRWAISSTQVVPLKHPAQVIMRLSLTCLNHGPL